MRKIKREFPVVDKRQTGRNAFTMIEILVVVMIIGILLAIGLGVGRLILDESDKTLTITNMSIITATLERYKDQTGDYPDEGTYWADVLFENHACKSLLLEIDSDYIKRENSTPPYNYTLLDGFGKEIQYSEDGGLAGRPRLTSAGPDGNFTITDDNIYSDKE